MNGWSHPHETLHGANKMKNREAHAILEAGIGFSSHKPANAPGDLKERGGVHEYLEPRTVIEGADDLCVVMHPPGDFAGVGKTFPAREGTFG